MPGGRPRKPTNLKLLHGTARKDRLNPDEPQPAPGPIVAPTWLHGRSRTAWKWVAPLLEDMGVLTTADVHAVALMCDAYAEYIECRAVVKKLGRTYESRVFKASTRRTDIDVEEELEGQPHGGALKRRRVPDAFDPDDWSVIIRPRPEVRMAADAWRRVHRMMVEFGLTASSRSKVSAGGKEETDPFDTFLSRRAAGRSDA